MKIDKRLLSAGLVAAIAVLALATSSASAAVWTHEGAKLSEPKAIGLTGAEFFETGSYGMSCGLHATLTIENASTGTITAMETTGCGEEAAGELAGCTVSSSEPIGLPWTVDVNTADLTITNWRIKRVFNAGCKVKEVNKAVGNVTVTLETPQAIAELEFLGQITGFKTFGSFTVDSPNSGTYGIG